MESLPFSRSGLSPEYLAHKEKRKNNAIESLEKVVKDIDFKVIDEILFSILKKIYPEEDPTELAEHFSFGEAYPINVEYSFSEKAGHYGENHASKLYSAAAYTDGYEVTVVAEHFVDKEGSFLISKKQELTKAIIHEIIHMWSTAIISEEGVDGNENILEVYSGINLDAKLKKENEKESKNGRPFILLNEAMTEVVTDAVYSEYLARTGEVTGSQQKKWYQKEELIHRQASYIGERMILSELVDILSIRTGVNREKVYQALIVEYFKNGDLMRSELLEHYKDDADITGLLEQIKDNDSSVFVDFSEKESYTTQSFLMKKELDAVKGLVSRDYIGEVNKRRVLRNKWYNVI